MKKVLVFEIDRHDEMVIDERDYSPENIDIAKSVANDNYRTLSNADKKKRLFEVRIMNQDEDGELDFSGYDIIHSVGAETRF